MDDRQMLHPNHVRYDVGARHRMATWGINVYATRRLWPRGRGYSVRVRWVDLST